MTMNPDDWAARVKGVFKAELKSSQDPLFGPGRQAAGHRHRGGRKKYRQEDFARWIQSCVFISVS